MRLTADFSKEQVEYEVFLKFRLEELRKQRTEFEMPKKDISLIFSCALVTAKRFKSFLQVLFLLGKMLLLIKAHLYETLHILFGTLIALCVNIVIRLAYYLFHFIDLIFIFFSRLIFLLYKVLLYAQM